VSPAGDGAPAGAPRLRRTADAQALAREAAGEVARLAAEAVAARGAFNLALSGGSTPRLLYRLLADPAEPFAGRVPWPQVHVFFGDERAVPPDDPASNYRMAREALLDRVPCGSVHRMEAELGAPEAATRYEAALRDHFGAAEVPVLDLALLGLGADGHTASLFPGSPALRERRHWVMAAEGPPPAVERITLTPPVLERARSLLFLVAGEDKAEPLRRLLRPRPGEAPIPAGQLRPGGSVLVLADRVAAALLDGGTERPSDRG
jgi:6-phosphogluconolactonase